MSIDELAEIIDNVSELQGLPPAAQATLEEVVALMLAIGPALPALGRLAQLADALLHPRIDAEERSRLDDLTQQIRDLRQQRRAARREARRE